MRRHHLIMLLPLFVTAGFIGWIATSPERVPFPIIVAVLVLGPTVSVAAALVHRWRAHRRQSNDRSLFGH